MDVDLAKEDNYATLSDASESGARSMDTSEDRVANSNEHSAKDISDSNETGPSNSQSGTLRKSA